MKLGIIREGKVPPDSRVPLTPAQCRNILDHTDLEIAVEPSPNRAYSDAEYQELNISLQSDLDDCDILLGVKEVPIQQLLPNKTYFFFSHTIKEQVYNRKLLQAVLEKNIQLIDYEVLTNERGKRLIAFGRFAGMVGAHNALFTYAQRTGTFPLQRMKDFHDYEEAKAAYQQTHFPPVKIVLTGTGRVGSGAAEVLLDMGIHEVSPQDFLSKDYEEAVFTQLLLPFYVARKSDNRFDKLEYYQHPDRYKSVFAPFTKVADIFINGIYWDNKAPAFFSLDDMKQPEFKIQVIADVTCDIAPVSSIPATIKASTIADPIFGFDPQTGQETAPHQSHVIDMMTIDKLPNELPRDASAAFGEQFIEHILPELQDPESEVLERATVALNGKLGPHFKYLQHYVSP
ncbi:MAG: alanine dehydrogenase [Phaeodactylibacter sp.]|nr:alanine dehydrogenase [Phaeodactylibacter sp.]